ncbi:MAG: 2,3,4,5-tetrahydropyridine-2,6-dicarboxylate N-succinyltransferase [Bacteroidota bacterium]|nr:2,3,4,5-tetrahydropyridine-2,6-dicarboxylate N-succinyltransferase [Bacteroidota bacterium]
MKKNLQEQILDAYSGTKPLSSQTEKVFAQFLTQLDEGKIRSAEKFDGEWRVHEWVKKGILLGFRLGKLKEIPKSAPFQYFDKHTFPVKKFSKKNNVRIVPGGTSVRKGAYVAHSVIIMPPAYINVGTYIDEGTLVDSHALVGSCAQIGKRVHLSAAAQIGGVLEPVGALPVIIEDDVLIGGNCGIYEGTIISRRAVIASGVVITASTPIYDSVNGRVITRNSSGSLVVPENAVVVAGSRSIDSEFGKKFGLGIYSPIIIKYRDEKTDARTALEESLR